ncbi:M1 family aminopeptidase [Botrimarina sp.]|uniref:M1 family aminopeptidase n=1 Tax=Botrimarina sp. TaxID=2795802 RepID=UPI0032EFB154
MPLRYLALGALLLCGSTVTHAEHVCRYCRSPPTAEALAAPNRRYAPPRDVDVLNLRIDVTPDFDTKTIAGETRITFTPLARPTREVRLDAVDLRVESLESTRPLQSHHATDEHLTLLFADEVPLGEEVTVTVRYTAEPKKGLYFRTADMGYPEGEDHLWTQGETHEAPHWFPCFDSPNERSSTEVICRVPEGMTVLSNGKKLSEKTDPDTGLKAVHWRQQRPHVNYLVCLVAGYFHELRDESRGVSLGFYTQPGYRDIAANSFQDTASILAYFEDETGVPYPWDKYDQATIRDFNWGGMENTTLTTLTHQTLYDDTTENLKSSRDLDAHELAHQWFGDYVTCKDWSHLWLNEGFATYYTHLYRGHKLGPDHLLYGLYRDAQNSVLPNTNKNTRPIVFRAYDDPWEQFDWRAYPKGGWVLHMLRSRLGEELYRKAIRRYLEEHALSDVVTDDLRQAFEEVSGRPLDAFFDQWVYHGGAPQLTVSHDWSAKDKLLKVTVKQGDPKPGETLLFTFPVTIRAHVGDRSIDRRFEVTQQQHDFYLQLPDAPDVVRFDPEYTLLAEVEYSKPQAMLERQLRLEADVVGRLRAAKALGEEDNKKAAAALGESLRSDAFYGVRIAAADALSKLATPDALDELLQSREQSDARVREAVVNRLGDYFDDAARDALLDTARDAQNPGVRAAALRGLAKYPAEEAADAITAAMRSETLNNDLAIAAVQAAGRRRDPALRGPLLDVLADRRFELPGRAYGEALPALARLWRGADDTAPARELLCDALADPALSVRLGAIEALGLLGDRQAAALLEDLAGQGGPTAEAADKALKALDKEPASAPAAVRDLRDQLRKLRESHEKLEENLEELAGKQDAADPAERPAAE